MMKHFLSCDWGTTSFRIRLVDIGNGQVIAEERSGEGIAGIYDHWQQGGNPEESKTGFYLDVVSRYIKKLEEQIGWPLKDVKLIISGMASSSIGFIDIQYSAVPLPVDGSGMQTAFIPVGNGFERDTLVISGVKTVDDVMRGEETQLIGCIEPGRIIKNELFIFPGTHSKHIVVKDNLLVNFKTYMSGELFGLLAEKSILKNAVERGEEHESEKTINSFKKGVHDAGKLNLLHSVFKVRTNQLFTVNTKDENYNYLSGLVIGAELKDLAAAETACINLVCGQELGKYYHRALVELLPAENINVYTPQQAELATVMGHLKIGNQLKIFA